MQSQFVTYKQAVALNKLGYTNISRFGSNASLYSKNGFHTFYTNYGFMYSGLSDGYISAPLKQEVLDWFRDKHNLHSEIGMGEIFKFYWILIKDETTLKEIFNSNRGIKSFNKAKTDCLNKLINIVTKKLVKTKI